MTPSPLDLLLAGRYQELLAQMRTSPGLRDRLVAEVAGAVGLGSEPTGVPFKAPGVGGMNASPTSLADRKQELRAAGDFSWGLLSAGERRRFLLRKARVVQRGPGRADEGRAQRLALRALRAELSLLYEQLDTALREDDLEWLLPLAENLISIEELSGAAATALTRYSALLDAAQRLGSVELELHALLGLSVAQLRSGDLPGAQAAGEQAAAIAQNLSHGPLLGAALHMWGSALALRGELSTAREKLATALKVRQAAGEQHGVAATLNSLAMVAQYSGDHETAKSLLSDAAATCRQLGDRRGEGLVQQNLAALAYDSGDYASARSEFAAAACIFAELGDRGREAEALSGAGFASYGQGDLPAARECLTRALSIAQKLAERPAQVSALIGLGNIEVLNSNFEAAQLHFGDACELATGMGDHSNEGRSRYGSAIAQLLGGDNAAAAVGLLAGLTIYREIDDEEALVDGLAYGAALLAVAGQLDLASRALSCAQFHAGRLEHQFDPVDLQVIAAALKMGARSGPQATEPVGELTELAVEIMTALEAVR